MDELTRVTEKIPSDAVTDPALKPHRGRQVTLEVSTNRPKQQPLEFPAKLQKQQNVAVLKCQDNLEFLCEQSSGKFKLIVTSPPYNIGKSYEKPSSLDEYLDGQKQVIRECIRVLHPQGSILLASRQLHR